MRIALVSEHASPLAPVGGVDSGGQNIQVAALARNLAKRGHQVRVYTRRDSSSLPREVRMGPGVTVEHVPAGPAAHVARDELLPHMPAFGNHLAERWLRDTPDMVHAHHWMSGLAALVGARDLDVPVVQTFHALGAVKRRHQGVKDTSPSARIRLEVAIARDVDAVLAACSDEVFELARLGVPRRAITIVPPGVDTEVFTAEGPASSRDGRPRLVAVGRLVERKGFDTIIAALPRIPDAELVIAGGPVRKQLRHDKEYRRLVKLATQLGVADRVTFLGRTSHEDMPALYRSADLVVSTPWYEPFGLVPLEAMACGTPVVATAVGGQTDTVVDGTTGVLVPPKRPDVLAVQIRDLLANPTLREGLGIAAADRVRSRYPWARITQETTAIYERVRAARDSRRTRRITTGAGR